MTEAENNTEELAPELGTEGPGPDKPPVKKPRDWIYKASIKAEEAKAEQEARKKLKLPVRALVAKAGQLKREGLTGTKMDPVVFYNCFVDLWMEARNALNRAKQSATPGKVWNPELRRWEMSFVVDERLVLTAVDTTARIVKDMAAYRKQLEMEDSGIPSYVMEIIERSLKDYPGAKAALVKNLIAAASGEKEAERV